MKFFSFFFIGMILFLGLLGSGCPRLSQKDETPSNPATQKDFTYQDSLYGFIFDYPSGVEMKPRPIEIQDTDYLGIPMKFFASLRDYRQGGESPENIFFFYAANKDLTIDDFTKALIASDPTSITISQTQSFEQGGLSLTKIINTTASGVEKTHYLFWQNGQLIVLSQFLHQTEVADSMIKTFRSNQ
jgi:hypothetical protein